jgi:hypothetical protein
MSHPISRLILVLSLAVVAGLTILVVPGAAGNKPVPQIVQPDTSYQTIRFSDGSSATLTLTTRATEPARGEGIDLGTVYAAPGAQTASARMDFAPTSSASPAAPGSTSPLAGSGSQTMYGYVTYTNAVGVQLWKWFHQISWNYAAYKVTSIYNQVTGSLQSCCLWDYKGTTGPPSHSAAGQASFTASAQGSYRACVTPILCSTKLPWVWLQGNGNGVQTGYNWGIG